MREIKFRGYNKNRALVYGNLAVFNGGPHIQINDVDFVEVLPETVGEFTSLKDKNGQEIYEGDILLFPEAEEKVDVIFYEGAFRVLFSFDDETTVLTNKLLDANYDVEVIGNIYENPELIDES